MISNYELQREHLITVFSNWNVQILNKLALCSTPNNLNSTWLNWIMTTLLDKFRNKFNQYDQFKQTKISEMIKLKSITKPKLN